MRSALGQSSSPMNDPVAALETWCDAEDLNFQNLLVNDSYINENHVRLGRKRINAYRSVIAEYRQIEEGLTSPGVRKSACMTSRLNVALLTRRRDIEFLADAVNPEGTL